ncbi:MAG TPA: hypothetical protein VGM67_11175 [Gemmatimonadaceae bacterium]|jgi:hypothetical protein
MKNNRWTDAECEEFFRQYEEAIGTDANGVFRWRAMEAARWAETNRWTLPDAPTRAEMLARRLREYATRDRRTDPASGLPYRASIPQYVKVNGERQTLWADADAPVITEDQILAFAKARRAQAVNTLALAESDLDHFYRAHPELEQKHVDPNLSEDVQWRLRGKQDGEDEVRKAS